MPPFPFRRALCLNLLTATLGGAAAVAVGPGRAVAQTAESFDGNPDLRVVARDATGITLEFRPTYSPLVGDPIFDGASWAQLDGGDGPMRLVRTAAIPLPVAARGAHATVEITAREVETLPNVRLAVKMGDATDEAGAVWLGDEAISRDRLYRSLTFAPVAYDPAAHTLSRVTRLVVRIGYGAAAPSAALKPTAALETVSGRTVPGDGWTLGATGGGASVAGTRPTVLSTGTWFRFPVTKEGLYRIDAAYLRKLGLNPETTDPAQIRIYGTGGAELDRASRRAPVGWPDDLPELSAVATGGGDGKMDPTDAVVFYGRPPLEVTASPANDQLSWSLHHSATVNYYWLTVDHGAATAPPSRSVAVQSGPKSVTSFRDSVVYEVDRENLIKSGYEWVGERLTDDGTGRSLRVRDLPLPGRVPGTPLIADARLVISATTGGTFTLLDGEATVGSANYTTYSLDLTSGEGQQAAYVNLHGLREDDGAVKASLKFVQRIAGGRAPDGAAWLDWVRLRYTRELTAQGDGLRFRSVGVSGTATYTVGGFTGSPAVVLDVTDPVRSTLLTGVEQGGGAIRFTDSGNRQYIAATAAGMLTPEVGVRVETSDLHSTPPVAYVLVAPTAFLPAAEKLAAHRRKLGLTVQVAPLEAIYNEFSGGLPDPAAIRAYIRYLFDAHGTAGAPKYLALLGDGSYDNRNLNNHPEQNRIPTYQEGTDTEGGDYSGYHTPTSYPPTFNHIHAYPTDDYFTWAVGTDRLVDLGVGRMTARTPDGALALVDKLIRYETASDPGEWRNLATLVADDDWHPGSIGGGEWTHLQQTEGLAAQTRSFDVEPRKIYLASYPTVNTTQGRRKPAAAADIIEQINRGTLVMNYTGHGRQDLWADERVLTEATMTQLRNGNRLAFFITAACSFDWFDNDEVSSAAEDLLLAPSSGAVGLFGSSRLVYGDLNSSLNRAVFNRLFVRDSDGQPLRLGDVGAQAKIQVGGGENTEKFVLLGDPGLRLALPRRPIVPQTASLNGQSRSLPGDGSSAAPVVLPALSRVEIAGQVVGTDGQPFSGQMVFTVHDATQTVPIPDGDGDPSRRSPVPAVQIVGNVLHRGETRVTDGRFVAAFRVPKDIAYRSDRARISFYAWNATTDAVGSTDAVIFNGTDSTVALTDRQGPKVRLYLNDPSFTSGGIVGREATLFVQLDDSSGINTSTAAVGHGLAATLDGLEPLDLSATYRTLPDTLGLGEATLTLRNLSPGRHRIEIEAYDTFNNRSQAALDFEVTGSNDLLAAEIRPYPNPLRDQTRFEVGLNLSRTPQVDVDVTIFTVAGRLVRSLRMAGVSQSRLLVEWDGRDEVGDRVSNGTYLYRVTARSPDGSLRSDRLGKAVVLR